MSGCAIALDEPLYFCATVPTTGLVRGLFRAGFLESVDAYVLSRKRHKVYCSLAGTEQNHPKDGLLRFSRYILTHQHLNMALQCYATHVLQLNPADSHSGEANFIVLTCMTIPDIVKGSGRILQLAKVELQQRDGGTQHPIVDVEERPAGYIFFHLLFKSDVVGIEGCHYLPDPLRLDVCAEMRAVHDVAPIFFLL